MNGNLNLAYSIKSNVGKNKPFSKTNDTSKPTKNMKFWLYDMIMKVN